MLHYRISIVQVGVKVGKQITFIMLVVGNFYDKDSYYNVSIHTVTKPNI